MLKWPCRYSLDKSVSTYRCSVGLGTETRYQYGTGTYVTGMYRNEREFCIFADASVKAIAAIAYISGSQFQSSRPPRCIFCMSLLVNTPDSDNQLVSDNQKCAPCMNCVPIDMLPTQCPLLPTPWAGEIRWSLLHFRTFINGFALRNIFTHRRVWHYIRL